MIHYPSLLAEKRVFQQIQEEILLWIYKQNERRKKEVVSYMITLYFRKKHGGDTLCPECAELDAYFRKVQRLLPLHGNKDLLHRPDMAIRHVIETHKEIRKLAHAE